MLFFVFRHSVRLEYLQDLRNDVEFIYNILADNQSHEDIVPETLGLLEALSFAG